MRNEIIIRSLGLQEYLACLEAMRNFTNQRNEDTPDEIWLLEHPPVYTQGQNGKPEHVLKTTNIPIIKVDRGGQITYHGPGQLVVYTLINLQRKNLNVRQLVSLLENSVIELLNDYQIIAYAKREAPGVYVNQEKICSVGLRIRRGCSYHGLALNISMDLMPFSLINPCGFKELKMTQMGNQYDVQKIGLKLSHRIAEKLGYTTAQLMEENYVN